MDTNTAQGTSSVVMNPEENLNNINSVVNAPPGTGKGNKKLLVVVGVLITLGAIGIATYLVQRESFTQSKAWNCTLYTFNVGESGVVTVANNSTRNEPGQEAKVSINGVLIQTFAVPALAQGTSANLGVVEVPASGGFTWEVEGTLDCSNAGSYESEISPTPTHELTPTLTTTLSPSVSPSVTVTPNPSESPTPTLTGTPGPSSTSTPGPSNTPTPTGTTQGTGDALADAGFGAPTIIGLAFGMFFIMGALLLAL